MSGNSSPSHSTDTSLSLSAGLLPEQSAINELKTSEQQSSISEHISSANSLENDRSLVEIEISNIPDINTLLGENKADLINASPPFSLNNNSNHSSSAGKNARSVLEEILHNEQFKSEERSDRRDSTDDASLNIFDGVQLDDDSINNYVRQLHAQHQQRPDADAEVAAADARNLDDALDAKDSIIRALSVEVESLRAGSDPASAATLSMSTCTEYKQLQEECATRCVSYESALAHRDAVIARMRDALMAAQQQEAAMRDECAQRARDVQCVQTELAEAVAYLRRCKCNNTSIGGGGGGDRDRDVGLDDIYAQLCERLGPENDDFLQNVQSHIRDHLESKLASRDSVHQREVVKLQEKHVQEMEDTRKFYEKKCADILSDELLSQPSRKLSDDELASDDDLADMYPDYGVKSLLPEASLTPEAVLAFKQKLDATSRVLSKYDMENLGEDALNALKTTLARFRFVAVDSQEVEAQYQREIDDLHEQLLHLQQEKVRRDAETQGNTGEQEIDGIVKSYQTQLNEQVELAKVDIMLALEDNISRLAKSDCDDDKWPEEFLEIRLKLSARYLEEIADLKRMHEAEVQRLKQEVGKARNSAIARLSAQRSTSVDASDEEDATAEATKTSTLRKLLIDCYQYFAQCEEELNTTLFDELARHAIDSDSDANPNETSASSSSQTDATLAAAHRVHLAPNIQDFIAKIDRNGGDVALEFKRELNGCLERLRTDANAILALTCRQSEAVSTVTAEVRRLSLTAADSKLREELVEAKQLIQTMEIERSQLDSQMETIIARNRITETELAKAREKIAELIEYGRKEIVSEGYGENVLHGATTRTPLAELNDRARQLLAERKTEPKTLQIIEELTREVELLVEDGKRERQDFVLQIDSADKKLKSTQRFLEEQAAEREQERDEAHRTISALRDQLKDMQKERAGYERVHDVVEGFEAQMHEMSKQIADGEKRFQEVNNEREEAIEKIGLLRDIIKDLEKQIRTKESLEAELKVLLERQRGANDDLVQQLEAATNTTDFQKHIIQLEEEVSKLRRANDIVGNEGLIKQIQLQLHDLELSVDKSIREIESLYATRSTTTCSTPSEEMSVQDQIRPKTPNSAVDDCEVPLQQLARLKEKLLRHSRAENSAIKRIQDMELQLLQAKQEHDELLNEKEVLQDQASEQLVLISSLQMRLDDQRIRAEHVQKQANASLEMRIYDLENDLQSLRDKLQSRESTIKQLNKVIEETKQRLQDREDELSATMEESEIVELKSQIDRLKSDNDMMRLKIESDAQNAQILPSLVDNIIADKNKDIESLRGKLEETERQFELYRSMTTIEKTDDVTRGLSYFNVSSPECLRNASTISTLNTTKFVPEMSSIEKVGLPNVNYTTDASLMKPNSTEINHKTTVTERHVHFEDDSILEVPHPTNSAECELLQAELDELREKLADAENTISELRVDLAEAKMHLTEREKELNVLHDDAKRKDDMYMKLAKEKRDIAKQFDTLDAIRHSIEDLQKNEEQLKASLKESQERCTEKTASFQQLQSDFAIYQVAKEEEIVQIVEENKTRYEELSSNFDTLRSEMKVLQTKSDLDVMSLKRLLSERESELHALSEDITRYQNEIRSLEDRVKQTPNEQLQLVMHKKELAEKELEIVKLKATIDGLKRETGNILDHLIVKEEIIDTMKVDSEALRINLETIKAKMNESGNIYDLRQKLVRERELNAQLHAENEASMDEVASQVRKQLNDSAQLDDKLLNALGSGDFNHHSNEIDVLEAKLAKERKAKERLEEKVKSLEPAVGELQETVRQLQEALAEQKKLFDHVQVEDTNLMTQIRGKLEEAMETEVEYEAQLTKERALRLQLENELTLLRRNSNSTTNSTTEYVSLGNLQEQRLQRQVKQLQDEMLNIKRELKNHKKAKNAAECELKYSKEMLELKSVEVVKLEKRIAERESEMRKVQDDLRQRKNELDMKSWEVESGKSAVASLEQEKLQLSVQLSLLKAKQPASPAASVPAFLQKMKDLGELVTDHISENRLMTDTIAKLTTERNQLEERIRQLESRDQRHVPFDDPMARANHLFGKYLRADSYRHALSYQKKYLIGLLATYQNAVALPLSKFEPKNAPAKRRVALRFRAAVVVCIAVFRMKYMVQRWHSGSRNGAYMSLSRKVRAEPLGTHFHVGKPVSGEHFRTGGASAHTTHRQVALTRANHGASTSGIPWSGMSPPSKDPTPDTTTRPEHFEQLRAPTVDLDSYFERFNLIQQRLGTTLNSFNS